MTRLYWAWQWGSRTEPLKISASTPFRLQENPLLSIKVHLILNRTGYLHPKIEKIGGLQLTEKCVVCAEDLRVQANCNARNGQSSAQN